MSTCSMDAKFKPGTFEKYTAIIQDYANGMNMWAISDKYHMAESSTSHVFERMCRHYNAVNTANLIAIMMRKGEIK